MDDKVDLADSIGPGVPAPKVVNSVISGLSKVDPFIRWVATAGMVIFVLMVCLTFVNVILRYVFNRPLLGTVELTEIMMVMVVFTGVAYTQLSKSHVTMDIVVSRLKPKPRLFMDGFNNLIGIALFVIIIWRSGVHAVETSRLTPVFDIPLNYTSILVPFGSTLLVLVLTRQFLQNIADSFVYKGKLWLSMVGVPILVIIVVIYLLVAEPISMSLPVIGIIGVILMFILFCTGMPVAFVLMGLGLVLLIHIRGMEGGLHIIGTAWYDSVASHSWAPIMFFMLMGYICFFSAFGTDIYRIAQKFFGHFHGGLAMGSVAACTAFGAVVGDSLSGSITMTAIGLPEMRRYKYNNSLAIGTLTCSGTIGMLIPPSLGFIIYSVLTEQSLGELFLAGIIPGLICAIMFMSLVYVRCRRNPSLGPPSPRSNWEERLLSLRSGGPVALLFILVIGGIYAGVFTPTEGGGIGAAGALIFALAMRRLDWKKFTGSLVEAAKFSAMVFTLLGGAMVFGYFIVVTKLPMTMAEFVAGMDMPPIIILAFILIIYFVLGCFLPILPLILITIPIFLPIAINMGWDLVWFGVITVLMLNMGSITPPFGINLFVMKGLTGSSLGLIYRGAMPFIMALILAVIIVVAFPDLSTWLPRLFH